MRSSTRVAVLAMLSLAACAAQPTDGTFELGAFPTPPTNTLPQPTAAALQAVLDDSAETLPGVAAAVISADAGVWSGAAGTADGLQPVEIDSQFGIGSITKTFIAAELMRLVEQGLVRLEDPVSDHLPAGLAFETNGATIGDLLAMRSGIPDPALLDGPGMETDPQRAWEASEILATVSDTREEPNRRFSYSNTNYILLGLVIEEITGQTVAEALRAHLTADLRLSSIVYQPEERPQGPLALPFIGDEVRPDILEVGGGYLPTKASASAGGGAGCMVTDAPALALWGYLLFGGQLISERSVTAMTDFGDDRYGIGVFDQSRFFSGEVESVGNGGWDPGGYSSTLVVHPASGLVIVVLTNVAGDPTTIALPIAAKIASALDA